jgi:hypothetical protein
MILSLIIQVSLNQKTLNRRKFDGIES